MKTISKSFLCGRNFKQGLAKPTPVSAYTAVRSLVPRIRVVQPTKAVGKARGYANDVPDFTRTKIRDIGRNIIWCHFFCFSFVFG
jgi:hypothetical protein